MLITEEHADGVDTYRVTEDDNFTWYVRADIGCIFVQPISSRTSGVLHWLEKNHQREDILAILKDILGLRYSSKIKG